ncbi:MAG: ABC transporter permease, partial [Rhodospirillaceae bacterium]|nr:ABC transporter permease [Rhodospirillaceae bacterium]
MATPLRELTPDTTTALPARRGWLAVVPWATLAVFLGPVVLGLIGTVLPAFGYLPALGGTGLSLDAWERLAATPGLAGSLRLSAVTGLAATALSLIIALGVLAAGHGTRPFAWVERLLAPLLAIPHAAMALGLAFLLAASGWGVRLLHGLGGLAGLEVFATPPLYAPLQDPDGIALTLGLVVKETPFLVLMGLAGLGQVDAARSLAAARALGYGRIAAWAKVVLPQLYPLIRLPLYAVLAFSVSVVDVALILGPGTPPPLAVQILRWFNDPDLSLRFVASAGACLQLALVVALVGMWRLAELAVARLSHPWLTNGRRGTAGPLAGSLIGPWARAAGVAGWAAVAGTSAAAMLAVAIWSVAWRWRFPDLLPSAVTLDTWARGLALLAEPLAVTVLVAALASAVAVALTLGCLEYEDRAGIRPSTRALWLLYTPLLVPQIAFLFGIQVLLVLLRLDGTLA